MLLNKLRRLLGMEKQILLSVLDTFPTWHSRYGEDTHFASKIKGILPPGKIHALKSGVIFWEDACRKLATGGYCARIVYLEDRPTGKVYYPITKCKTLHTQRARYAKASQKILVEGKPVAVETVAGNEGLACNDFLEFLDKYDEREFVIVHFTGFRY
ncbi:hypothetical protein [Dysgonomonas termitidis]|uniref:Transposase n=1 Tax=Dysgonomonas termitidis TaxID=1516126 RepID=A0ABV9L395_9BACT